MNTGKAVCKNFIDGLLYPQSLGEGLTPQELT
jgi:hypothetical protein